MEFALFVWFASVIGNIAVVLTLGATACLGTFIIMVLAVAIHNETARSDDKRKYPLSNKMGKWALSLAFVGYMISAILPSEKTMYLMAGAYAGQQALQSETAAKVVTIVNSKLDEYIAEAEKSLKK
jgi:hypothetical protein